MASRHEKPEPQELRSLSASGDAFVDSVRAAISANLVDGNLTIDRCARHLVISRRTLQRLLSEAGWTFTRLIDEVRLERARQLLADESRTVADVAAQLGYANSANFAKAFQRLSGVTPGEFRSRMQEDSTG
jgi:AraC-like DNA-binding protein